MKLLMIYFRSKVDRVVIQITGILDRQQPQLNGCYKIMGDYITRATNQRIRVIKILFLNISEEVLYSHLL